MKKVELVKGIESSVLGFGCAPILGSAGFKQSKLAIDLAIECGINHFDIARSYGYGDAERFLGNIIYKRRHEMVIASKFGIKANLKAQLLRPVKPVIRYLRERSLKTSQPKSGLISLNANNNNVAQNFLYRIRLDVPEMHKSLEQSLRALRTDYLDYFFVHEPLDRIENIDKLATAIEKLKHAGKIRAWGVAYMFNQVDLHKDYINAFDVLQFNNPVDRLAYENVVAERGKKPNIIFSPLRSGLNKDLSVSERLTTLSKDFSSSVILCSMFNEEHLRHNCSLFD